MDKHAIFSTMCMACISIHTLISAIQTTCWQCTIRWAHFAHPPAVCDLDLFHYITAYIRMCVIVNRAVQILQACRGHSVYSREWLKGIDYINSTCIQGAAFQNCDACACIHPVWAHWLNNQQPQKLLAVSLGRQEAKHRIYYLCDNMSTSSWI